MKEFAKSMISFSLAMSFAGARGLICALNRQRRSIFLGESEEWLRESTTAAVNSLNDGWREAFRRSDQMQRSVIEALSSRLSAPARCKRRE